MVVVVVVVVEVVVVVVDNCPAQGGFIIGTQFIIEIWGAVGYPLSGPVWRSLFKQKVIRD